VGRDQRISFIWPQSDEQHRYSENIVTEHGKAHKDILWANVSSKITFLL
jgi:hypothetical protein